MLDNHKSDCSTHNEPAYPNGECDCGVSQPNEQFYRELYEAQCEATKVVQSQLQQTREELERYTKRLADIEFDSSNDHGGRKMRDALNEQIHANQLLIAELSAKDKVLEGYEEEHKYQIPNPLSDSPDLPDICWDFGKRARTILSQYKGDTQ